MKTLAELIERQRLINAALAGNQAARRQLSIDERGRIERELRKGRP